MDPAKLKVVELRAELSSRGLDTKGNKAVLVKRLREAIEKETGNDIPDTSIADTSTEDLNSSMDVTASQEVDASDKVPEKESSPVPDDVKEEVSLEKNEPLVEEEKPEPAKKKSVKEAVATEESMEVSESQDTLEEEAILSEETDQQDAAEEEENQEENQEETMEEEKNGENGDIEMPEEKKEDAEDKDAEPRNRKSRWSTKDSSNASVAGDSATETASQQTPPQGARGEKRRHESKSPERATRKRSRSPVKEDEPVIDPETVVLSWIDSDLNLQINKETFTTAQPLHNNGFGYMWAGARSTHGIKTGKVCYEVKLLENLKWEENFAKSRKDRRDDRRDKNRDREDKNKDKDKPHEKQKLPEEKSETTEEIKPESTEETKSEPTEDKPEETKEIKTEPIEEKAEPIEENTEIKTETEVKTEPSAEIKTESEESKTETEEKSEEDQEKMETEEETSESKKEEKQEKVNEKPEPHHCLRIGWSLPESSLQLGEAPHSYGYDSDGLKVVDSIFEKYAKPFAVGDVVTAHIDLDVDPIVMNFSVNGEELLEAFSVCKSDLPEDFAFFPHIATRNIKYEVNFGANEVPFMQLDNDYNFIKNIEEKVAGPVKPEKREDCEVIMMIGLPCCGKTHWVKQHVEKHPEKKYLVLGNTFVLERMKYNGKPRKDHYKGGWTSLLDKCSRCVTKMVEMAALRRRNYILDQTNLYTSAQRRRLRPFEGFHRRAVVCVCDDTIQKERETMQHSVYGKNLPDTALLEMKANFSIPVVCDWLNEVTFAELEEKEAQEMVQKYNKQGREAGYGPNFSNKKQDDAHRKWGRNNNKFNKFRHDNRTNRYNNRGNDRDRHWSNQRPGGWGGRHDRNHHSSGGWRGNHNNRMVPPSGYGRSQPGGGYRSKGRRDGGNKMRKGNWGGNQGGSWGNQGGGSWGGQGWGHHGQGGGSGSGWSQGGWGQYNNSQNQSGGGGGNQSWKNYGGAQQGYQQGYGQGYPNQYGSQQYGWNYYNQYAQGWNNNSQSGQSTNSSESSSNQYNYPQQTAWAQYQSGYNYSGNGGGNGGQTVSTAATQPASTQANTTPTTTK